MNSISISDFISLGDSIRVVDSAPQVAAFDMVRLSENTQNSMTNFLSVYDSINTVDQRYLFTYTVIYPYLSNLILQSGRYTLVKEVSFNIILPIEEETEL